MITLDSILESAIVEIIVMIGSFIVSIFLPKLIIKDKNENVIAKHDPLIIAIFFESFLFFNFIYNLSFWKNSDLTVFLVFILMVLGSLIVYISKNQCPSCKKFIKAKKMIDNKNIKEFKRDYKYQPMEITLYSNGKVWKQKPVGKEKTRIENWITKQEFYECSYCGNKWDSGLLEVNLDKETRPGDKVIQTDKKDPNQVY